MFECLPITRRLSPKSKYPTISLSPIVGRSNSNTTGEGERRFEPPPGPPPPASGSSSSRGEPVEWKREVTRSGFLGCGSSACLYTRC
ncbi:hypothetical protein PILCRDRAFT_828067 [Piloderma croceum F 1598]|uniref:Uncharacterized protein n=1 Tax=Piloderma croceum (strain F 1598) TaxID=765440 RepID=A0A0C3F3Q1_PILCF|nr:hypothetical protein PILCRDRAFT_828067 [Piloderma croceum F 1598]